VSGIVERLRSTGRTDERAEERIQREKPPYTIREGGSRLCFVKDPDGYRVEILEMAG